MRENPMSNDGTPGQELSQEDAALLASAHLDLLKAQMSGEMVLGSTAGGQLVAAAHRKVAESWSAGAAQVAHHVLLSLVHAGRDLVIPLSDRHGLVVGMSQTGKCGNAGFVTSSASTRNEVSA
jgi:hypothetical protein